MLLPSIIPTCSTSWKRRELRDPPAFRAGLPLGFRMFLLVGWGLREVIAGPRPLIAGVAAAGW